MIENWGRTAKGEPVSRVTINRDGLTARLISFGATLQDLRLTGRDYSLVLGYGELESYLSNPYYFGSTVGRYANRIAGASAMIDGVRHNLDRNALGKHHIHGGRDGAPFRNWTLEDHGADFAVFSDLLPDGHMGFPGALSVSVTYRIEAGRRLTFEVNARTDAPTLCNFTSHNYFNLDGEATIGDHDLQVLADHYIPVDAEGVPLAGAVPVADSPFDYRKTRPLKENGRIADLDHNYCLGEARAPLRKVATLSSRRSGLRLDLATTEPGLQVYAGAGIGAAATSGRSSVSHAAFSGLALEPQIWPDAPNRKGFPSAMLRPGEHYLHRTQFSFAEMEN